MLSKTWDAQKDNIELRTNLFRDLSRIFLSFARLPLDQIGSFIVCDDESLRLANRPLSLGRQDLENEGIPIDMPRGYVYSSTDSYVIDSLAYHDSRLQCQPNAINDTHDFIYQTSTLTAMRTILPLFFRRELRRGPFFFCLTDLHQSNIFVDEKWHITALVDLEWGCSLPAEMIQPPHWFVDHAVDRIDANEFDDVRREFMEILAAEETNTFPSEPKLSGIMNKAWEMGTFWYTLALTSPSGLFTLFDKMIQPDNDKTLPGRWLILSSDDMVLAPAQCTNPETQAIRQKRL
ncbi:hypothetical protein AOCH_005407 [Aspergillus ochraceoroseus]|uniref:Aminoglycoside phosphotransferase domain-containing protein n=1 Tax=Aspergillus ochraceoroseus TaxID=138278 RepID=A0A0F8V7T6_9EURO|nr:hypothetical protein AOCH_005407 [Aspergillus ochraceoroseus]